MAKNGYFDKNKDYSLEIRKAQDRGASRGELEQLRRERQNKIDSRYDGADPYRGRSDIMGTRRVGAVFQADRRPGVSSPAVRQTDLAGGPAYANKRVQLGDWTYVFNDKGRQIGKVRDHGASANGSVAAVHKDNSPAHRAAYEAAGRGDWDGVGVWLNRIAMQEGSDGKGGYNMEQANRYNAELQLEFGKSAHDYQKNKYEKFLEEQQNGGAGGAKSPLEQLLERSAQAERSRLRAMYDEQVGRLESRDELLGRLYTDKRNQAAASNELERQRINELGLSRGLNTGAAGQLALGQSAAYQGILGGLHRQETADRAENARKQNDLWRTYQSQVLSADARHAERLYEALEREKDRRWKQEEARLRREAEAEENRLRREASERALRYRLGSESARRSDARERWEQERQDKQDRWDQEWTARQEAEAWEQALKRAGIMAEWGDFSGYQELGLLPEGTDNPWKDLHSGE